MIAKRSSSLALSGSGIVIERGSSKTLIASANPRPCFRRFAESFLRSHSKAIPYISLRAYRIESHPGLSATDTFEAIARRAGTSVAGVPVRRIINAGGIPQKNAVLNQVYANVMGKPILVPDGDVSSLGSAIFAFMAAGAFRSIEAAQDKLCPGFNTIEPEKSEAATCQELFAIFRRLYFAFGQRISGASDLADILPELRRIAAGVRGGKSAGSAAS
jgi:hypothetical protein